MYQVDQALCTGCGLCLDACQAGAIALVDGWAQIDDAACIDCGSCARACPQDAILVMEAYPVAKAGTSLLAPAPVIVSGEAAGLVRRPEVEVLPATPEPRTRFWPMVGSALVWAARELLPEVISAWRTSRPEVTQAASSTPATPVRQTSVNRPKGHRHRWGRA